MTKDEAIELLEDLDGAIEDNHGRDYDEAFRMAIEALQTEQQTEEEMLREQCRAFIDIVNHTEKGESHEFRNLTD